MRGATDDYVDKGRVRETKQVNYAAEMLEGTRVRKGEDGCPSGCLRSQGNIPCVLLHFLGGSSVEEDSGGKIQ